MQNNLIIRIENQLISFCQIQKLPTSVPHFAQLSAMLIHLETTIIHFSAELQIEKLTSLILKMAQVVPIKVFPPSSCLDKTWRLKQNGSLQPAES